MRKEMNGIIIEIPDAEIEKYAIEHLNMAKIEGELQKIVEIRANLIVQNIIDDMIMNDWDTLLEQIDEADLIDYMENEHGLMRAEDFVSDWTSYVEDYIIEEYARDHFNMMTEDEAIEFAKEKLDE